MLKVYLACVFALVTANDGFLDKVASNGTKTTKLGSVGDDCNALAAAGMDFCSISYNVPEAQGWTGGWCLASMAEAGWLRSSAINSGMSIVLATDVTNEASNRLPVIVATSSGGSLFGVRYFTMRQRNIATKWSYPCYLLTEPYKATCYFHSPFGDVSSECNAATFDTVTMATNMVYWPLFELYGGPLGTAATYAMVYFPFISSLALQKEDLVWKTFAKKFVMFSTEHSVPSNWLAAHTVVSPAEASQSKYNYGFDSYLSRSVNAYDGMVPSSWGMSAKFRNVPANISVVWITTASANTQTGVVMTPLSFAATADAPAMKLFSLMLSYVMVQRLTAQHQVMTMNADMNPSCTKGCPVMDGGFSDNGPITPTLSAGANMAVHQRPVWMLSVGAGSTASTVEYLMGQGPMKVLSMGGNSMCPFEEGGMCTSLDTLRKNFGGMVPGRVTNAFEVMRPQVQLLTAYCADPLAYDMFKASCQTDGVCSMMLTVIPSALNNVQLTAEVYSLVFVVVWLAPSPLSRQFVQKFMPPQLLALPYFATMGEWFPNFDAMGKDGMAFSTAAGNAFMDFMTFLNIRVVNFLFKTKKSAAELRMGEHPKCGFEKSMELGVPNAADFRTNEKVKSDEGERNTGYQASTTVT